MAPITVNGGCYIIQAYPNSGARQRASILREFPGQHPRGVGAFLRNGLVDSDSPESFASAAGSCPVFQAIPRDSS